MRVRLLASAALAAFVGFAVAPTCPAHAAEPLNIRTGWVVMSGDMAPMVFEKRDILKHYGKTYTVDPIHFKGTSAEITALAANELDIASLAYSSLPLGIENAHLDDLRVIADGFQDGHPGYASIPYMVANNGGIKKIEDLKGKIMAINVIGAAVDIGGRAVLADHGLNYPRDYTIIEANFPTMGAMLLDGKANIASLAPPFNYQADVEKGAHTLFTMRDGMGASQMIVLTARAGFLKKNRAALDDFFDDLVRATHWMLDPKNREQMIQFVSNTAKQPVSMFAPYYLTKRDEYRDPNNMPDLVALQRNIEAQVKFGFVKQPIDVKKYSDLSFVERAAKRYAKEETASAK